MGHEQLCDVGGSQLTFSMPVALRPEEIERFQSDPEFFTRFRHQLENTLNVSSFLGFFVLSAFVC